MTVTGTREKALLSETPEAVGTIASAAIHDAAPLHPGQLLSQIPGVAVAVTNGEGHTTAIRQPFTTNPVYLYLEDGIPVRATGFFNHNALYEVNLPMAGGVEVVRGPGTALYGSDAIGGIINVLSRTPIAIPHAAASAEAGSFGTWRLMTDGGAGLTEHGAFNLDLNVTHTDGWRDTTAYDRQSGNLRLDEQPSADLALKTTVATSRIDQKTGANSPLPWADYIGDPTRNLLPVAYRKVSAFRASVEIERTMGASLFSVVPYFRDNAMELNGSFNLNSDPRIEKTHNVSYGMLAKWRESLPAMRTRLIAGIDLDYSPGSRQEDNLLLARSGTGANTLVSAYTLGTRIYDYRVTFESLSPYVHTEFSPTDALRLTAGLRYDSLGFELRNRLAPGAVSASVLGAARYYGQIDQDKTRFERFSPKLGATYALNSHAHLYASYNVGFRAPSESQLYRAGNDTSPTNALARAHLALGLKPIKASQAELGIRGDVGGLTYDVVAYDLVKRDDLVSQRDLATNVTTTVNAGKTEHRGVEAGLGLPLGGRWRIDTALSYSQQRYVEWVTATSNFSGKNIEAAPHLLANTRLTWRATTATVMQFEWIRIGAYWLEASNSPSFGKYPGHDLLNVRGSYAVTKHVALSARLMNLAGKRFADSASVVSNTPVFSPGLPRAYYGAVEYTW